MLTIQVTANFVLALTSKPIFSDLSYVWQDNLDLRVLCNLFQMWKSNILMLLFPTVKSYILLKSHNTRDTNINWNRQP